MPSTVTNLMDCGPGSLRDAIATTPDGGTIDFQPGLTGTITLTTGSLGISKELTISGPGANLITVSGGDRGSVFGIGPQGPVTISGLTMAHGLSGGEGGAIRNDGTLTVLDSIFSDNLAVRGAGIANFGTLTIMNSTFRNNIAEVNGGGIYNIVRAPTVETVINSTFTGNAGCAISLYLNLTLIINDSTFYGNGCGIGGAGQPGAIILHNTILAGNYRDGGPDVFGLVQSEGYNLIGDGSQASGFTATDLVGTPDNPIDPMLGPLQDNGGPTLTQALLPGSPALNTGDPSELGTPDQRGVVRTGGVNIGAYQAGASAFTLTAPDTVTSGMPFDLTVTAVDIFGQIAIGYAGTVTFSSSDTDAGVVLPADYTFTAADGGSHTFSNTDLGEITLITPGDQTITATDTADNTITGSVTVTVDPGTVSLGRAFHKETSHGSSVEAALAEMDQTRPWQRSPRYSSAEPLLLGS
jgi:hypothetical protein